MLKRVQVFRNFPDPFDNLGSWHKQYRVWETIDGVVIPFPFISNSHLSNIIQFVKRSKLMQDHPVEAQELVSALEAEQSRRLEAGIMVPDFPYNPFYDGDYKVACAEACIDANFDTIIEGIIGHEPTFRPLDDSIGPVAYFPMLGRFGRC